MACGMSFSVSAVSPDGNNQYPIVVEYDSDHNGTAETTVTVYLNADGSYNTGSFDGDGNPITAKYSQPGSHTIENVTAATAFDALFATGQINSFGEVQYLDPSTWAPTGIYGIAINTFCGQSGYSVPVGNKTRYFYWDLEIKDDASSTFSHAMNYATNYLASNIKAVKLTFTHMDY